MYTLYGEFEDLEGEFINGSPFFRKMSRNQTEHEIAKVLMEKPHPNIVTIYRIGPEYIDMELLDFYDMYDSHYKPELLHAMSKAKEHLQSLGIMYIDWKPDNTGISREDRKTRKLFDFDASALIDVTAKTWIREPPPYMSYMTATERNLTDPYEIDNFSFIRGFADNMFVL